MKALSVWQPQAYLAGVLHGDGWCTDLTLGLRCKDLDFSETFAAALNDACGTQVKPKRDERGYWLIRQGNKSGRFSHLKAFEPSDNDHLSAWLRGLFDSEGNAQLWHMKASSFHRRIAIYSTSMSTIERAAEFLDWLDVPHSIRATRKSRTSKGTKTVFELRMVRKEGFERFRTMVGSSIARKEATIRAITESYQPEGWQARNWAKAVKARWGEA